ncbi:hypothetical protein L4G92_01540 [Neisseria sp. ZJ106]|uniref:Uncharacterized protein n=1 Tax=Neisseria lisongii TaxID=2912188 RepID=A0ABY7RM37_9NEIS|nr:hypothetical protein [Neisseria lisongii]MCF7520737.1 hypothetical protein [Neisseria lisongii]WCL72383.1 hypothetical protein PJU73_04610 [Neisseria lisongii]
MGSWIDNDFFGITLRPGRAVALSNAEVSTVGNLTYGTSKPIIAFVFVSAGGAVSTMVFGAEVVVPSRGAAFSAKALFAHKAAITTDKVVLAVVIFIVERPFQKINYQVLT